MKILGIIQARMGSNRLPGKMLMPIIDGKGALELMLERVSHSRGIDKLMVATTIDPSDDAIVNLCDNFGVECFRGSVDDVLDRFYAAVSSQDNKYDGIVRLTGDCPLHCPKIIDRVIQEFVKGEVDYMSNVNPPTFPDGLDVEVFTCRALHKTWEDGRLPHEREHVTQYICNHPEVFSIRNVSNSEDLSSYRWTLDEEADLTFTKNVYQHLYRGKEQSFGMEDILDLLEKQPGIRNINCGIKRNEGLKASIKS